MRPENAVMAATTRMANGNPPSVPEMHKHDAFEEVFDRKLVVEVTRAANPRRRASRSE